LEYKPLGREGQPLALLERLSTPVDGIPAWRFAFRVLWVAVQVILIFCLGQQGVLFFYQGF
jgi:hypothetical protein